MMFLFHYSIDAGKTDETLKCGATFTEIICEMEQSRVDIIKW